MTCLAFQYTEAPKTRGSWYELSVAKADWPFGMLLGLCHWIMRLVQPWLQLIGGALLLNDTRSGDHGAFLASVLYSRGHYA